MFKDIISTTPLTSQAADAFFHNIVGHAYRNDNSFTATLRALVAPRMSSEDRIALRFTSTNFSAETLGEHLAEAVVNAITRDMVLDEDGVFIVHNFCHPNKADNEANMRLIEEHFIKINTGFCKLDKVTDLFRRSFPALCYVNADTKSTIIFIEQLDMKKYHYVQCAILAAVPWYFEPEKGISEVELALMKSLKERTPDVYMDCLTKIAAQYDFRTARIRNLLKGFETRVELLECDKMREKITCADIEIKSLNDRIGRTLSQRNEYCIRLLGLENKIASAEENSEIMEYFLCNKRLILDEATNSDIYFSVADYVEYFDVEMAERVIANKHSFVYRDGDGRPYSKFTQEQIGSLVRAIFLDGVLRIRMCAAFVFTLSGNVSPRTDYHFSRELNTYMPNPHIQSYGCMGGYQQTINSLLAENNYIGAFEQCIASCKSLNWSDSSVMSAFMSAFFGNNQRRLNNRCIELPDGSVVTPEGAIKWLATQEEETNAETKEEA